MPNSCLSTYTLKGIGFDCSANIPGIKKVYLTYFDDATVTPVYSSHTITGVTLSTGVSWYEYDFAPNTSSLNSVFTKNEENGSRYYTNTISLQFNKMTADKHLEVMALGAERLAAIVVDKNDKKWYVGADNYITGTNTEAGTGDSLDSRNGYTVTLEGTSRYLPFEYTGEINSTPAPTVGD